MSQKYFEYFKYKIHIAITNHISKQLNNTGQFKHAGICNLSLFYSRQWSTTATKSELCLGENNRKNMESEKRYYSSANPVERAKKIQLKIVLLTEKVLRRYHLWTKKKPLLIITTVSKTVWSSKEINHSGIGDSQYPGKFNPNRQII